VVQKAPNGLTPELDCPLKRYDGMKEPGNTALGNTGSKTTIHRYLREIEAEEGGRKVSISDALQALITQLSDQLQNEAATAVDAIRAEMVDQHTAHERVRSDWKRN
jgi:hypothetical protein